MQLLPLHTPILKKDDDIVEVLRSVTSFQEGDILVLSSKAVATTEGAAIDLSAMQPTAEAIALSKQCHEEPRFIQAVLEETARMNGTVQPHSVYGFLLTDLEPDGFAKGRLLVPNAGLDRSNIESGFAVGWPRDPVLSTKRIRTGLRKHASVDAAVILTDSGVSPKRLGLTAFALSCAGIDPFRDCIGMRDIFGRPLKYTIEAVADQLATAANFLMGNAGQTIPGALIRDHGLPLSSFEGWVEGIETEKDLYHGII